MAKNFFKNKRVLVTGGLGFIGSNLAIKLVSHGASVTLLDALIKDYGGNIFNINPIKENVEVKIFDMRDSGKLLRAVKNKDIIFNLAGTLSHIDSMTDPFTDLDINCRAQLSLLEACRKHNPNAKIVFAGTRNQYGKALYLPVDEKHLMEPTDINGINSIAGEKYHLLYGKIYGLKVVSLRMTNTYGPRHQMRHPRQGVFNWFLKLLIDGKTVELFGDGLQIRDLNYVDDVVDALIIAAIKRKSSGEAYNLGGQPVTLREFVETSIKILGRGKYITLRFPDERKSIEVGNYVADTKKIRDELGWRPKVKLEDGIKDTLEYFRKHRAKYFS